MFEILKKIYWVLFYNPNKFIKKYKNIVIQNNTILLKSCNFQFSGKNNQNNVRIGDNTMVGCNFVFESDEGKITVGNNSYIGGGTTLISRSHISIGNNVTISWGCTIYDHNSHSLDYKERQKDIQRQNDDYRNGRNFIYSKNWDVVKTKQIIIEDNVWIGFDCTILSGVTIGEGAVIGAHTVVRKDVEPWTVVVGNPAQVVKKLSHE